MFVEQKNHLPPRFFSVAFLKAAFISSLVSAEIVWWSDPELWDSWVCGGARDFVNIWGADFDTEEVASIFNSVDLALSISTSSDNVETAKRFSLHGIEVFAVVESFDELETTSSDR